MIQNLATDTDPQKAMRKIIMKTLGERDYAAQETMHHLNSLKLHSSSFNVIPVSLNGSRRIRINSKFQDQDGICTDKSLLDVYANREHYNDQADILSLNFVEFATRYKVVNKKLQRQADNIIPRIFPTYSPNPKGANYPLYCKYQLLRYKPWKTTQSDAWSNQQETEQMYINSWQEFLETEYAKTHVPNWIDQLQNVIQSNQEIHNEPLLKEENQLDEWMILSNLFKPFDNEQTCQIEYDWHLDKLQYSEQQICEMPAWINIKRNQFESSEHEDYAVVDVNSFSEMQRLAYDIVCRH